MSIKHLSVPLLGLMACLTLNLQAAEDSNWQRLRTPGFWEKRFGGVAPDESVAWEFGKVNFLYAAKLGTGDRCEMETFAGPHTINGKWTFDFLHKHLRWPK